MNEQESRREALADMIRISEEAGLYETIDVGSVDWNKTAVQYMELNKQKTEAIHRVRELAENAFHDGMGREMDDPRFHYRMFAALVLQALDGEQ